MTPASFDLFKKGLGALLGKEKCEIVHIVIATRSRPDGLQEVSVLSGRAREIYHNN